MSRLHNNDNDYDRWIEWVKQAEGQHSKLWERQREM